MLNAVPQIDADTQSWAKVRMAVYILIAPWLVGFAFAFVFALLGRALALITFESDPTSWYQAHYGVIKARGQYVMNLLLNFAIAGFFVGFVLPWIYVIYGVTIGRPNQKRN